MQMADNLIAASVYITLNSNHHAHTVQLFFWDRMVMGMWVHTLTGTLELGVLNPSHWAEIK